MGFVPQNKFKKKQQKEHCDTVSKNRTFDEGCGWAHTSSMRKMLVFFTNLVTENS